jgi:hypothetical protein
MIPTRLAPDVAFVLAALRRYPIVRRFSDDRLGPLAFGFALDARIEARLAATDDPGAVRALEDQRIVQQQVTRACAWRLGLLSTAAVHPVPRDAAGRDCELSELLPVDRGQLLAVARAYLDGLDRELDAASN